MQSAIHVVKSLNDNIDIVYLLDKPENSAKTCTEKEQAYLSSTFDRGEDIAVINQYNRFLFFVNNPKEEISYKRQELYRKKGYEIAKHIQKENIAHVQIAAPALELADILSFTEGFLLSCYQFLKYKSTKKEYALKTLSLFHPLLTKALIQELENIVEGTFLARDLVNEPAIFLSAEQLSQAMVVAGKEAGFHVEVLNKLKIKSLKMGGLLAVNSGSIQPPTFSILEYRPENAVNSKPYMLVGKGVVYDTGGLSLKPTPNSMDMMKSDMAGAAAVTGAMYAIAKNKLPVNVIGLIPATDNRPGGNAITPGDVITIFGGKTVEILNTDAEGRLILADALVYAQKYEPEIVIDLATLTGAAAKAIGKEGMVMMGNAREHWKNALKKAGNSTYERLVEFPLWEEYEKQLESEIADINNLGGSTAGAITAGLFLQHFTDYEWIHLDIAGPAFISSHDNYRGKHATGVGVRLLYNFVKSLSQK